MLGEAYNSPLTQRKCHDAIVFNVDLKDGDPGVESKQFNLHLNTIWVRAIEESHSLDSFGNGSATAD